MYGPPFQPDGTSFRGECPAAFGDRTLMGAWHVNLPHKMESCSLRWAGPPAPRRLCSYRRPALMRDRC